MRHGLRLHRDIERLHSLLQTRPDLRRNGRSNLQPDQLMSQRRHLPRSIERSVCNLLFRVDAELLRGNGRELLQRDHVMPGGRNQPRAVQRLHDLLQPAPITYLQRAGRELLPRTSGQRRRVPCWFCEPGTVERLLCVLLDPPAAADLWRIGRGHLFRNSLQPQLVYMCLSWVPCWLH
jgi:hypothetical protein